MKYKKRIQAKLQTLRASVRIVTYIYIYIHIYIYMNETQRSEHETILFHTRLIQLSRTHAPLRK